LASCTQREIVSCGVTSSGVSASPFSETSYRTAVTGNVT